MSALTSAQGEVAWHMDEIKKLFKPGVKITVIVRTPNRPTWDFMMGDDAIEEVEALLARRGRDRG